MFPFLQTTIENRKDKKIVCFQALGSLPSLLGWPMEKNFPAPNYTRSWSVVVTAEYAGCICLHHRSNVTHGLNQGSSLPEVGIF